MEFPDYFADAEENFNESNFVIFSIPFDKSRSFRSGTQKAPASIRQASWNFEPYDILSKINLKDILIHDYGDIEIREDDDFSIAEDKIRIVVEKIVKKDKFPIAIGGDHSVSIPIVDTFNRTRGNDFGVVVLDAHLDFKYSYQGSKNNHACVVRRFSEIVGVENVALVGVRSSGLDDFKAAEEKNLFFVDSFDFRRKGVDIVSEEVNDKFKDKNIYLSFDFDCLDPSFAPGVSNPEPFGLSNFEIFDFIGKLSKKLIGFDLVEVNPTFDNGETSMLAAKIIRTVIQQVII